MTGLNGQTGRAIDPASPEYLRRSIADILMTPIGSRVMRRDYGSRIPDLIDQPLNDVTRLRIYAATATALLRSLKRARLTSARLAVAPGGSAQLKLDLVRTDQPRRQPISLTFAWPPAAGATA